MKIGFDGRYAQDELTGIGKYIKNLVEGVSRQGFKCVIFYSQKPKYPITGKNIKSKIIIANKYLWEQIFLPKALKQEKIDIYHATGNIGIPLFCPIPSILTVHDIIPLLQKDYFKESKTPFLSRNFYYWRSKTSLKRARIIIADTKWTKKTIINTFKIKPAKITVTYLDSPLPSKLNDKAYLQFNLKRKGYIINTGGIARRKNLINLIVAFALVQAKIPQLKLVITGQNKNLFPKLKKEVQRKGLTKKVVFTGFLPEEKLWGLLKNALCLCYPSRIEGFGLPVIEAFRARTPVIASNIPVLKEVGDSACLFVEQDKPQAIAQAIIRLAKDCQLQKKLIIYGQRRAEIFSWEKTIKKTIEVYRKIAEKE